MKLQIQKLTDDILIKLKATYKGQTLFKFKPEGWNQSFVFRLLDRETKAKAQEMMTSEQFMTGVFPVEKVNDLIFNNCVVWPTLTEQEKNQLPVGAKDSLAKSIQEKSGFFKVDIFGRPLQPGLFEEVIQQADIWAKPTDEDIDTLKENHPFALFKITVGPYVFVVRQLSNHDMNELKVAEDEMSATVGFVTLYPKDVMKYQIPTGTFIRVFETILKLSGYNDEIEVEEIL